MKPVRNRRYCNGCNRSKILFESEEKANNFIRYNSEEILAENGKAPVRSYYCHFCGGWHVTSSRSTIAGERLDNRDNKTISDIIKKKEETVNNDYFTLKFKQIERNVYLGKISLAKSVLETCEQELLEKDTSKKDMFLAQVQDFQQKICLLERYRDMDDDDQKKAKESKEYKDLLCALDRVKLDRLMEDIPIEIRCENGKSALKKTNVCLNILWSNKNNIKKSTYKRLENELINSQKEAKQICNKQKLLQSIHNCYRKNLYRRTKTQEYRSTILELIHNIEQIEDYYSHGDLDRCEDLIDISNTILELLNVQNEDTRQIRLHLKKWQSQLQSDLPDS